MKHLFSDSFGVDHKVTTQRAKIFCLDYRRRIIRSWLSSRPFRADVLGFILECHVAQLRGHISEGSASFYVHAKANCCGRLQKKRGLSPVCSNSRWSRHQRFKHWQISISGPSFCFGGPSFCFAVRIAGGSQECLHMRGRVRHTRHNQQQMQQPGRVARFIKVFAVGRGSI